jgi:hypothetical protein
MDPKAAKDTVDSIRILTSKLHESIVPLLVNHAVRLCSLNLGGKFTLSAAAEMLAAKMPNTEITDDEWAFALLGMETQHSAVVEAELANTATATDQWFRDGKLRFANPPEVKIGDKALQLETGLLIVKIIQIQFSARQMQRFTADSNAEDATIINAKWKLSTEFEQVCVDTPCSFDVKTSPLPQCFSGIIDNAVQTAKEFKAAAQHAITEASRTSTLNAFLQAQGLQLEKKVDHVVVVEYPSRVAKAFESKRLPQWSTTRSRYSMSVRLAHS